MKKIPLLILFVVFAPLFLFADDEIAWVMDENENGETIYWPDEDIIWGESDAPDFPGESIGPFRIRNRTVEIGLANINLAFSNDFLSVGNVFQDTLVLDLDLLRRGLGVNFGLALNPVFFSYNRDDRWGFGFSTGIDMFGTAALSGPMLTLGQDTNGISELNAAAFSTLDFSGFFHIERFRIRVGPSVYLPIAYMRPREFIYINRTANDETFFYLGVNMEVFTAFPAEGDFSITASPGVDLSISVEYPLADALALNQRFPFLDFTVGVDIVNIPIVPAVMRNYSLYIMSFGDRDNPIDLDFFEGEINFNDYFHEERPQHLTGRQNIFRPFKMLAWAAWKPFMGSEFLTVIPSAGFAVNPLFQRSLSFEGGLQSRISFANFFIINAGIGYHNRLWKNSLGFSLNFRVFQFDFGASLQAPSFAKSWTGGGFGLSAGLRFGW